MPSAAPTQVRFRVAGMLFITVAINYLDRSNLSVASIQLARDLRLDPVHMGLVFSAFGWTYAFFQIPGGWLVDRVGARALYACVCALWSLATLAQGFAQTFLVLLGLRLVLGLFEAPAFPICNKLATSWFPENERAAAIGFYTGGQYAGLAFLTFALVRAQARFGWHSVFFITGAIGLAWSALWYLVYRDPAESRGLSGGERDHIRAGGGWVDGHPRAGRAFEISLADLRLVLTRRRLWGIYIGQFALNAVPWFFLTWFPMYLVSYRHMDFIGQGLFSSLPFFAAFCGVVSGGLFSDWLARRGASPSVSRKAPIIGGMLLSTCVVGANFVSAPGWVEFFLTVAFFGNGFASITWTLVSLMAPRRLLGLTGGVFNFCGNLAAMVVPLVIGVIVKHGGFAAAMVFIAAMALVGALSYIVLVDRVERIPDGAGLD
ncbi:MAG TPA: MFS transporter [Opitutaceae bacterium]|nr:MFS transporter [Opitutaceae bacterium]